MTNNALRDAVLDAYPGATALQVAVDRDENNPGYFYPSSWRLFDAEGLIAEVEPEEDGPFDQELNDYVDDLRITDDFTLNLGK